MEFFSCISEETTCMIPHIFAALCTFWLEERQSFFPADLKTKCIWSCCPLYLIDYLDQRMTDVSPPKQIAAVAASLAKRSCCYQQLDDAVTNYKDQNSGGLWFAAVLWHPPIFSCMFIKFVEPSYLKEKNELFAGRPFGILCRLLYSILTETEVLLNWNNRCYAFLTPINLTDFVWSLICIIPSAHVRFPGAGAAAETIQVFQRCADSLTSPARTKNIQH